MTDDGPYNYCPRCGDELEPVERDMAADLVNRQLPPLCRSCFLQLFKGVTEAMADVVAGVQNTIGNALQGMAKAMEDVTQPENEQP